MSYFLSLALVSLVVFAVFALFIQYRSFWVYNKRVALCKFEENVFLLEGYASYGEMLARFWVWDIEKFRFSEAESTEERTHYHDPIDPPF